MDFTMCFKVEKGAALAFVFVGPAFSTGPKKVELSRDIEPSLRELENKGYAFNVVLT